MSRILVVEGKQDQDFYSALCRRAGVLNVEVRSAPGSGKGNAIKFFEMLLKQLPGGSIKNVGVVVDADYPAGKGGDTGFGATYAEISNVAANAGFAPPPIKPPPNAGYLLTPPAGLQPAGVWIMPDNSNHGMVEDFVKQGVIDPSQKLLLSRASNAVEAIANPLFNSSLHKSKAEVYTWLAWQKNPGSRLVGTVGGGLIDMNSQLQREFLSWLKRVFP